MMKFRLKIHTAVVMAVFANAVYADEATDVRIAKLQKALEEQQSQMQVMAEELKALQQKPSASVVASVKDGIGIKSSDGDFTIKMHGLVQVDNRSVDSASATTDGWMIRKARPWIDGTLFGWIDYRLTPEFATTTGNVATSRWFKSQWEKYNRHA